jgi:hypothetical protein
MGKLGPAGIAAWKRKIAKVIKSTKKKGRKLRESLTPPDNSGSWGMVTASERYRDKVIELARGKWAKDALRKIPADMTNKSKHVRRARALRKKADKARSTWLGKDQSSPAVLKASRDGRGTEIRRRAHSQRRHKRSRKTASTPISEQTGKPLYKGSGYNKKVKQDGPGHFMRRQEVSHPNLLRREAYFKRKYGSSLGSSFGDKYMKKPPSWI